MSGWLVERWQQPCAAIMTTTHGLVVFPPPRLPHGKDVALPAVADGCCAACAVCAHAAADRRWCREYHCQSYQRPAGIRCWLHHQHVGIIRRHQWHVTSSRGQDAAVDAGLKAVAVWLGFSLAALQNLTCLNHFYHPYGSSSFGCPSNFLHSTLLYKVTVSCACKGHPTAQVVCTAACPPGLQYKRGFLTFFKSQ